MQSRNFFFYATAALAALAAPAMAASISYVTTFSSIFAGGVDNNYDSVTGLSQHAGNCYLQGGGTGPCATLSSNPSTNTAGLTASSVSVLNGVSYDPNNGISEYGEASAYANLATGMMGGYANGPNCSTPNASGCDSSGNATAEFQDSLTFNNTTGATADIDVSWSFDGTTTALGTSAAETFTSLFCLAPGSACSGNPNSDPHGPLIDQLYFSYQDGSVLANTVTTTAGWVSTSSTPGANATSETFQGVFAVPAGVSTDSLNAYLEVGCLLSTCDFSHTGSLSLGSLPDGVTFTSESGVLLSDATPEPGTWALLLCGGILLGVWRTRKACCDEFKRG
jgi:hypothetical protein